MRTFDLTVGIDVRVVVPDEFTAQLREDAEHPNATPFMLAAQGMFPEDDDEFTLHILKHGIRRSVRAGLQELLVSSGLGGTLAPATAKVRDTTPPSTAPVSPAEVREVVQDIAASVAP